jgi:uncharacterized protein YuzE
MKISYDAEVDALSITFRETTVTSKHLAEGIAADYDSEGRLAGLEILDAQKRFGGKETMQRVELEGLESDPAPLALRENPSKEYGVSKKNEFLPRYENKQTVYPSGLCRAGPVIGQCMRRNTFPGRCWCPLGICGQVRQTRDQPAIRTGGTVCFGTGRSAARQQMGLRECFGQDGR